MTETAPSGTWPMLRDFGFGVRFVSCSYKTKIVSKTYIPTWPHNTLPVSQVFYAALSFAKSDENRCLLSGGTLGRRPLRVGHNTESGVEHFPCMRVVSCGQSAFAPSCAIDSCGKVSKLPHKPIKYGGAFLGLGGDTLSRTSPRKLKRKI